MKKKYRNGTLLTENEINKSEFNDQSVSNH